MEQKTIEKHFHILGLEPGASLSEVKEAYRFLVQTFHEDKYPADHPYRERAKNKMIELNDSYGQLKKFFEENPSGAPAGGWHQDTAQDEYRGTDDAMDWKSWQHDQEQSWDSELHEWLASEQRRRQTQKDEEEKGRRKTIVKTTKCMAIAAFFYLLAGHSASHGAHQLNSAFNTQYLEAKRQYDLETNGTASSAFAMSRSDILAQDNPLIQRQQLEDRQEAARNGTSLLMLFALGGALIWVFRSRKAADLIDAFIEGNSNTQAKQEG